MQFGWINFYSEFASKLLLFKNDRKTLISKINAVYAAIDMKVPKLESGDEIIDIDPFTVFGLFNKGITNGNRIAIIGSIAKEFGIEAKVPDNFDGIPVLNNLKATFYGFKDDRKEDDIDNIWNVFKAALALADEDNEENRQEFSKWYDLVHDQLCIRWNLTMGLYWIRPYCFINLDSRNRWYLTNVENMPADREGCDIGPKSQAMFAEAVKTAKTVVWNGPMGVFENPTLAAGTIAVAKALAETDATTIIGGGDSAAAVNQLGFGDKMSHISTGGGASLEFLEGKVLPGVAAADDK